MTSFDIKVSFNGDGSVTCDPPKATPKKGVHDSIRWIAQCDKHKFLGVAIFSNDPANTAKTPEWSSPIFGIYTPPNWDFEMHSMTVFDQFSDVSSTNLKGPIHSYSIIYSDGEGNVKAIDPSIENEYD